MHIERSTRTLSPTKAGWFSISHLKSWQQRCACAHLISLEQQKYPLTSLHGHPLSLLTSLLVLTTLLAGQKFASIIWVYCTVQFDNMLFSRNSTSSLLQFMVQLQSILCYVLWTQNSSTWTSQRKTLKWNKFFWACCERAPRQLLTFASTPLPHNLLLFMSSINSPKAVKHKRRIETSAKSH